MVWVSTKLTTQREGTLSVEPSKTSSSHPSYNKFHQNRGGVSYNSRDPTQTILDRFFWKSRWSIGFDCGFLEIRSPVSDFDETYHRKDENCSSLKAPRRVCLLSKWSVSSKSTPLTGLHVCYHHAAYIDDLRQKNTLYTNIIQHTDVVAILQATT